MAGYIHGSSVVLVALLTSAVTAAACTFVIERYQLVPPRGRDVLAPSLVGLSEADARGNAQALQIPLLVEGREPSAGAIPGTVLRQSVAPGQLVPEAAGLGVVFAASYPKVPKVTELPFDDARALLARKGFKAEQGDAIADASIAAGHVSRQVPEPDAELEPGGRVVLLLSSGPGDLAVPKLGGLTIAAATEALAQMGLVLKVRWISKAETETNVVLSQKPEAGEKIGPRGTVEVVANR
jgi:beta-lactam-binding protein with PASTA domain